MAALVAQELASTQPRMESWGVDPGLRGRSFRLICDPPVPLLVPLVAREGDEAVWFGGLILPRLW